MQIMFFLTNCHTAKIKPKLCHLSTIKENSYVTFKQCDMICMFLGYNEVCGILDIHDVDVLGLVAPALVHQLQVVLRQQIHIYPLIL